MKFLSALSHIDYVPNNSFLHSVLVSVYSEVICLVQETNILHDTDNENYWNRSN